jgi:predicted secreted protein
VDELPTHVTLPIHGERVLRLPSAAGAGYLWSATVDDDAVVRAEMRFDDPATTAGGHPAFGAHELLTLRARAAGTAHVRCRQERSWERAAAPLAEHMLTVTVVADQGDTSTEGEQDER